jgi:hypothetical protein
MPELLAEQQLDIRLVVNHENKEGHAHAPAFRRIVHSVASSMHEMKKLICDALHIQPLVATSNASMLAIAAGAITA